MPENKLTYMEPLCTISEYRNRGLESAAISELYRRMRKLGATQMTGGINYIRKSGINQRKNGHSGKKGKKLKKVIDK